MSNPHEGRPGHHKDVIEVSPGILESPGTLEGDVVENIYFFNLDSRLQMALLIDDIQNPRYLDVESLILISSFRVWFIKRDDLDRGILGGVPN
jgi:hypothetical protein